MSYRDARRVLRMNCHAFCCWQVCSRIWTRGAIPTPQRLQVLLPEIHQLQPPPPPNGNMDSDEWDDDIADEDLITAFTQASQSQTGADANSSGNAHPFASKTAFGTSSAGSRTSTALQHDVPPSGRAHATARSQADHLDDLPPDAFESSPVQARPNTNRPAQRSSSQALRQTTLWGEALNAAPPSQVQSRRLYRADMPPEIPTHHKLDHEALKTWVYPTNLGPVRDYQFSIVKDGLFNNTLVALPTGLGKTFIAATVMLNYYRWTKDAKIVFVAPTKPLASQQVEACLNVAGIPRSHATLLTGEVSPALREGEWEQRRLFFMTPQTLQNDLSKGYADPKSITLLVIDEAHRATGDYAYVKVVEFIRRFNQSFRVLALTATPGSTVEGVQAVIDSLGISTIEIRTEESIDIRQYVHSRGVDQVVLEPSDEMLQVQDLFSKTLRPLCNKLTHVNKWLTRDPMTLTVMGLREAQRQWALGAGRHANPATKGMVMAVFAILQSLAHAIKLLNYHGIAPFYHKMLDFRSDVEGKGSKGSKNKRQVVDDENFQEMMDTIDKWQRLDGFVGHPKLSYLCESLLNHFMDAGQGSNTRAIVFSEYRDSAEEIVRTLNRHKPLIKASIFVGQADSKRSEGMKQKQQIETIENFRAGHFNVLVATSIGEEGLDIGQVDLIVCYDASASPIRMLQRMGRTGRKRAGNVTLLLMKGKEEEQYRKAKDNYEKMQRFICEGTRFNFRTDLSSRIVPRNIKPEVDMCMVEIPIENTQDTSLPEPKKRGAVPRKKASKKKFNMPDGVITGFVKASNFGRPGATTKSKPKIPLETEILAEMPALDAVLLDRRQTDELNHMYRNLPSHRKTQEDITGPDLGAQPKAQRKLSPVAKLKHGAHTKRCVRLFRKLANAQSPLDRHVRPYGDEDRLRYREVVVPDFAEDGDVVVEQAMDSGVTSSKRYRTFLGAEDDNESPLKRRKSGPKSKTASRLPKVNNPFIESSGNDDDDEGLATGEDEVNDDSRTSSKRFLPKSKPRKKPTKARRRDNDLVDDGDDCTRTSQLVESDGSDDGADLLDFINDGPISSMPAGSSSPTLTTSPPAARSRASKQRINERFYELQPPGFQEDSGDDDIQSLSQLGGKKTGHDKSKASKFDSDGDSNDDSDCVQKRLTKGRRRKPTIIEESDYE